MLLPMAADLEPLKSERPHCPVQSQLGSQQAIRLYYLLFALLFLFLLPVPGKMRWEMRGLNGLRICHSESALSIRLGIIDKVDLLSGN